MKTWLEKHVTNFNHKGDCKQVHMKTACALSGSAFLYKFIKKQTEYSLELVWCTFPHEFVQKRLTRGWCWFEAFYIGRERLDRRLELVSLSFLYKPFDKAFIAGYRCSEAFSLTDLLRKACLLAGPGVGYSPLHILQQRRNCRLKLVMHFLQILKRRFIAGWRFSEGHCWRFQLWNIHFSWQSQPKPKVWSFQFQFYLTVSTKLRF